MMQESNKQERIKIIIAFILAVALSFGLGYLIRGEVKKSPIIIEKHPG